MRYLPLALVLLLTACNFDVDLTPQFRGADYTAETFEVFEGTLDSVIVHYRAGAGYYFCNSADLLTYVFDTNAAVLNADSSQVSCETNLIFRTVAAETSTPLIE